MKIIEQSHEIISLPDNLLQIIEIAGRTCYKSEDKTGCTIYNEQCPHKPAEWEEPCIETWCEHHSFQNFIKMLLDQGHHAMIEFGDIIVRFITNRGVTHELVRHRLCSFAQESTRYVRYDGGMEFIRPVWLNESSTADQRFLFRRSAEMSEELYINLLNSGWRPEQAREVLPNSLKTEIVVKANIREWRHCLTLRTSKKAHPQIRSLLTPLLKELQQKIPILFDDIKET
jgi:thymidylate synthase (FAD)